MSDLVDGGFATGEKSFTPGQALTAVPTRDGSPDWNLGPGDTLPDDVDVDDFESRLDPQLRGRGDASAVVGVTPDTSFSVPDDDES